MCLESLFSLSFSNLGMPLMFGRKSDRRRTAAYRYFQPSSPPALAPTPRRGASAPVYLVMIPFSPSSLRGIGGGQPFLLLLVADGLGLRA